MLPSSLRFHFYFRLFVLAGLGLGSYINPVCECAAQLACFGLLFLSICCPCLSNIKQNAVYSSEDFSNIGLQYPIDIASYYFKGTTCTEIHFENTRVLMDCCRLAVGSLHRKRKQKR